MTDSPPPGAILPGAVVDFDFTQDLIENAQLNIFDVFRANLTVTKDLVIRGKTFRNCLIEGPAVIMPLEGCSFDACDFGYAAGDINNLLLKPMANKVTGAMVFANTKFERCTFFAMGFTGPPQLLEEFRALQSRPTP
jgi:uncharacterized protein YjbI with pentapeptide repeats